MIKLFTSSFRFETVDGVISLTVRGFVNVNILCWTSSLITVRLRHLRIAFTTY